MDLTIQPQEPPPPSVFPEPSKSLGWLKWVLVIVVITLLSSGATYLVFQQLQKQQPMQVAQSTPTLTPDTTANWNMYTNTRDGYSIKYPSNWVGDLYRGSAYTLHPPLPESGPDGEGEYLFSGISISVTHTPLSLEDFVQEGWEYGDFAETETKKIVVNGVNGIEKTIVWGDLTPSYPMKEVFLKFGPDTVYSIFLEQHGSFPEVSVHVDIFDKIVSTLKFLGQEQIDANYNKVKELITSFYKAFEKQDGKLLFSYMTQPETSREKGQYSWLTGTDLGSSTFYRVFLRVQLTDPSFKSIRRLDNNKLEVKITDQMRTYSQVTAQWSEPRTRDVSFIVIGVNNNLLINNFIWHGNTKASVKYSGFPNVESN